MVRFIICIALLLALSRHAAAADAERSFVDVGLQQVIVIKSLSTNVRLAQVLSQAVCGICLVGQQMGRRRAVCRIASGQHERKWAEDHVGKGMDFRGLPAPRGPDSLIFRPPFPPCAERCALTQVLSMDGLFVTAPDVASASTRSIQKRLRDHLLKRL